MCATRESEFGVTIPEVFPENINDLIPIVDVTGLGLLGANQLFRIQYLNHTFTDNFSWQRGSHALQVRRPGDASSRRTRTPPASARAASRSWPRPTGRRRSRASCAATRDGACAACSYTEAERDIDLQLRFNRFEFYAQDTWRAGSNFTVDYGVRYSLYPPMTEKNDLLVTFDRSLYNAAQRAARSPTPPARSSTATSGDLLVGIIQAGVNSPFGRGIYEFKKNSIQPRIGFSWDPASTGDTIAPRRLRHLLRPAARRHLRAELLHDAADRQQRHVHQPAAEQPGRRADADDDGRADDHRHRRPTSTIRG